MNYYEAKALSITSSAMGDVREVHSIMIRDEVWQAAMQRVEGWLMSLPGTVELQSFSLIKGVFAVIKHLVPKREDMKVILVKIKAVNPANPAKTKKRNYYVLAPNDELARRVVAEDKDFVEFVQTKVTDYEDFVEFSPIEETEETK